MFHFSTDRLAGLDNMVLKITTPQKVPTMIHNIKKPRPPLTDKNNLAPPMRLHVPSTAGDILTFRPLPPLPSASTLELPSFLNFSTQSVSDPHPRRSSPALFRVSSSPVPSSRRVIVRKTRNSKVYEGPQWIPAFHHPNSPYVPWPSSVRRRILPLASSLSPSPRSLSFPRIRSGAVAPEPWASSTFSQAHRSQKNRLSSSWKSFKCSVKEIISRLGKSTTLCTGQDVLCTYDDTDTPSDAIFAKAHCRGSHDSLASFVSSDSRTLVAWLAERRATASCVTGNEMSVEDYELVGSWLDLRHCDGGWLCGIQDCDVHTAGGSPCAASEVLHGLRTAMPFDSADLLSASPRPFPPGSNSAPARSQSLPRLPIYSAQEAELKCAQRPTKCRDLSMPGGWTF